MTKSIPMEKSIRMKSMRMKKSISMKSIGALHTEIAIMKLIIKFVLYSSILGIKTDILLCKKPKSDKNCSIRIIFIMNSTIKINIIKIYIENTHSITKM